MKFKLTLYQRNVNRVGSNEKHAAVIAMIYNEILIV